MERQKVNDEKTILATLKDAEDPETENAIRGHEPNRRLSEAQLRTMDPESTIRLVTSNWVFDNPMHTHCGTYLRAKLEFTDLWINSNTLLFTRPGNLAD